MVLTDDISAGRDAQGIGLADSCRYSGQSPSSPSPKSGDGFLAVVVGSVQRRAGTLVATLDNAHRTDGRKGYGAMAKLSAHCLQHVLNIRYANRFLAELDANPKWLALCGLNQAPSESAYSRFKKLLSAHQNDIDEIYAEVVVEVGTELGRLQAAGIVPADAPVLGKYVAMDSTDVEAYGNPRRHRPADSDATWGYRTPKNKSETSKDVELFYGYKVHEVADTYYGLPLGGIVLPANAGDGPQLPKVLAEVQRLHSWMSIQYLVADKAYAGLERLKHLVNLGIVPVVAVPRPRKDEDGSRLFDGIYTADGRPTCLGGKPMEYVRTDPEQGHLFRCPGQGCALKHKMDWSRYCDSEVWEKPEGRLLRIVGILPRFTDEWNRIYKMRPAIERYFRSGKHSRLLDQHQCLEIEKVSLHVKISRLSYLATVLAHLKANDYAKMRRMRVG
ncbi:MAG: transposase [Chloroflexi bacterium]|nr:transposase [Chloroflexota bacterium]MYD49022.1 transposase [Chloroflexota bacterium]